MLKIKKNEKIKKETSAAERNEQNSETKKSDKKEKSANPKSPLLGTANVKLSNTGPAENVASGKNNSYTLQIGSFNNIQTAERMKMQLAKDGISAYIISKGDQHRVRVGKSMNEEKTITMESQLNSKKFGSFRIKE